MHVGLVNNIPCDDMYILVYNNEGCTMDVLLRDAQVDVMLRRFVMTGLTENISRLRLRRHDSSESTSILSRKEALRSWS